VILGISVVSSVAIQAGINGLKFGFPAVGPFFIFGGMTIRTFEISVHSCGNQGGIQNIVRIHQSFFILPGIRIIETVVMS
jgi:hypothetical protein